MDSVRKRSLWGKDPAVPTDPRALSNDEWATLSVNERTATVWEFAGYLAALPYAEAQCIVNASGQLDERTQRIDGALTMELASAKPARAAELLHAAREVASMFGRFAAMLAEGHDVGPEDEQVIRRALAVVRGESASVALKNMLLSLLDAALADLRRGEKNKLRVPVTELVGALREFVWGRLAGEFPTRFDASCRATFDEVFDGWCGVVGGAYEPGALEEKKHTKHISPRLRLVAKLLKKVGAMDEDANDDSLRGDYHALKRRRAKAAK